MRGRRKNRGSPVSLFSLQDIITCLTGIMILIVLMLALESMESNPVSGKGVHVESPDPAELEATKAELEEEKRALLAKIAAQNTEFSDLSEVDKVREILRMETVLSKLRQNQPSLDQKQEELRELLRKQLNAMHTLEQEVATLEKETQDRRELVQNASTLVSFLKEERVDKSPHLLVCDENQVQVISLEKPIRDRIWTASASTAGLQELMMESNAASEYFVIMLKPSGADIGLELYRRLRSSGFQAGYDTLEENALVVQPGDVL